MRKRKMRSVFDRYDPTRARKINSQKLTPRYIGIAAVFLAICLFYTIKLVNIQRDGEGKIDNSGNVTRTYTVAGLRGEIYDRNGVLLVGNDTSYDIVFEYGAIPDTTPELNRSILASLEAIEHTGSTDCLSEDMYALVGSYPNFKYSDKIKDTSSDEYKALLKVLDSNKLDKDTTADELADVLQKKYKLYEDQYTTEEINSLLRVRYEMERIEFGYYNSYTLAKDVPAELVSYIEESGIEGINFKISYERVYHYPGYATHILGNVGKIQEDDLKYYENLGYSMDALVGNSGCEEAFEGYLHSQDGILAVVYDENGSVVDKYYEEKPISGNDVWLTIDIELQIAAEDKLRETIDSIPTSNAGASVALDPNSGAILAVASFPTYDMSKISESGYYGTLLEDSARPLLNRAFGEIYAPGSVYKIGAALAGLEEGHITSSSTYTCNQVFTGAPMNNPPTCLGNHGPSTVTDAIRDSCNIFFYSLGLEIGCESLTKYTKPLGLGVATGVELYEATGTVGGKANAGAWDTRLEVTSAIGQANHAYTPLQISVYTASLTNGGTRYSAHLLDSVHEFYTSKVIFDYEEKVLETVEISNANKNTVLEGMKQVVSSSIMISRNFSSLPVTVGGKTGTAEVTGKTDNALFAGVAPYNDPEIVAVCVLEEGVSGSAASQTVGAIFKAYYDQKAEQQNEQNGT